jgi:hypothetical protein
LSGLQRTASDDEEEERRATPSGFLEFAESYRLAALALTTSGVASPHAQAPVRLLRYHAVELYLKAFLRLHGHSAAELCGDALGHDIERLAARAGVLGLAFEAEDGSVLSRIAETAPVVRARYFRTASYAWPEMSALARTCDRLHASVGAALANGMTT